MEDGNEIEDLTTSRIDDALGIKYELVENEYIGDDDIYIESPIVKYLKRLQKKERELMIVYAELGSVRKVASLYREHHTTISRKINKIKKNFEHLKGDING